MADVKDHYSGHGGGPGAMRLYHDEADGTYTEAQASQVRGWDATDAQWYRLLVDHVTGALIVKATLATTSIEIGTVDQGTAGATPWLVSIPAYSVSSQVNLTTTATVSAAAGRFGGGMFINLNAAPAYLQVFDTTGAVVLGTTVPTFVFPIPANATPANGSAYVQEFTAGLAVSNGIKVAATSTPTGAGTVGTGLTGFVLYK